ncbi:MAG: hypothetical protein KIG94_01365 [Acetatifactor sp.]|nr:hypothetical protein [Acetatifactor sp.]
MSHQEKRSDLVCSFRFSEEEQQQYYLKLLELLTWQSAKYNGTDSTSMPAETAKELLASLVYTLSVAAGEDGMSDCELLKSDLRQVIGRGQAILDRKRTALELSWGVLCLEAPNIPNVYYMDTMKNLGEFFKHYELYYFAHQIPCSIDYPLLGPIEESVQGISFIEEYMRRLRMENQLIHFFGTETVTLFLNRIQVNYREEYGNLCEPVLVNAIGRVICGMEPDSPDLTGQDAAFLEKIFAGKSAAEIRELLSPAMERICRLAFVEEVSYFEKFLHSLVLRIEIAVREGNLTNIFLPVRR